LKGLFGSLKILYFIVFKKNTAIISPINHHHFYGRAFGVLTYLTPWIYDVNSPEWAEVLMFGNIGFPELLIILLIALLIFGPRKLPEVGKNVGRALREFRRASDELKEKLEDEIKADDLRHLQEELRKDITKDGEG